MIGFVGMSHLGLVSSIAAAAKGFEVLAVAPNQLGAESSCASIHEPGLEEVLASTRNRRTVTTDVADLRHCSLTFLSLDTPTDDNGEVDLRAFDRLMASVLEAIPPRSTLVVLSQVPPGTTRDWLRHVERVRPEAGLSVYYQVETLIFGRALERALTPERYIVGATNPEQPLPTDYRLYLESFGCPVLCMGYESAELCKMAINCFLASTVCTTNFLAGLSEKVGADWADIAGALRLDRRIGPHAYLTPGLGIAGGNLLRDLVAVQKLARSVGTESGLVDAWKYNSRYHRDWVLRRLHTEVFSRTDAPVLAVWGLAYKADTASTQNSPAVSLLRSLRSIPVRVFDPQACLPDVDGPGVVATDSPLEACQGADALVVMTPWRQFSLVPLEEVRDQMRGQTLIDPYSVLDREQAGFLGFDHFILGSPAVRQETIA